MKMLGAATLAAVILIGPVFFAWSGPHEGNAVCKDSSSQKVGTSGNPTLSEVRQQCNEIAAFFPVDLAFARRWVPQTYRLEVDAQGKASGALILMNCPKYFWVSTPNSPPLQQGKNTAPGSVVHLWFMLQGPAEVLPVPGAQVTAPTRYAYAVADLVTSPVVARVYRSAGKNIIRIHSTTLVDYGKRQTAKIVFASGHKITLEAYTATQLPAPLRYGGNIWHWHVSDQAKAVDSRGSVTTGRVMFLATVPGRPNSTQVTIHADLGTPFAQYFGATRVVTSRGNFLRPNNIVTNSSRGELAWNTYPPYPIPVPPSVP